MPDHEGIPPRPFALIKVAMRIATVILTAAFAVGAAAQGSNPAISSISPAVSPTAGGQQVVIAGSGFETTVQCILPCPTTVTFGGKVVTPAETTNTRIVAVTPPHSAGVVDVTVTTGDGRSGRAASAFTFADGAVADLVLLPIYLESEVPGALGSRWSSDLWIRNNGPQTVSIWPVACPPGRACPAIYPLPLHIPSGESVHGLVPYYQKQPTPARMFYVTGGREDDLSVQLRVADVSRGELNSGTEIPVVRRRHLRSGPLQLLNVPALYARVTVRIYDVGPMTSSFRVRAWLQAAGPAGSPPLVDQTVTATTAEQEQIRTQPAYAEVSLPTLGGPLSLQAGIAYRVEITPLTPGSLYWAFSSSTNNTTQQFTIVTPQ